jgi:hypothetical protein
VTGAPAPALAWLLAGDRVLASSRLQGYLVHDELSRRGFDSRLVVAPPFNSEDVPWPPALATKAARTMSGRIVLFQKLRGPRAEALQDALRADDVPTVYVHADLAPDNQLPFRCELIVCSSRWLAERYRTLGAERVIAIADPAEAWCDPSEITGERRVPGRLRLAWVGHRASWPALAALREALGEPELKDFELVTVSNHPEADFQWDPEVARRVMRNADVGVVPVRRDEAALGKSANRVVMFMAAGLPVVADVIPAYEDVVTDGETGFLCDSRAAWRHALHELRSAERRREVAVRARARVDPEFRIERIVDEWLAALALLGAERGEPATLDPSGYAELAFAAHSEWTREALRRSLGLPVVTREAAKALVGGARSRDVGASAKFAAEVTPALAHRAAGAIARRLRR